VLDDWDGAEKANDGRKQRVANEEKGRRLEQLFGKNPDRSSLVSWEVATFVSDEMIGWCFFIGHLKSAFR
jgi:hypothetical protein